MCVSCARTSNSAASSNASIDTLRARPLPTYEGIETRDDLDRDEWPILELSLELGFLSEAPRLDRVPEDDEAGSKIDRARGLKARAECAYEHDEQGRCFNITAEDFH